ncbi:hypothetical protein B0H17DRAFT_1083975, partial [Mycena rosella]
MVYLDAIEVQSLATRLIPPICGRRVLLHIQGAIVYPVYRQFFRGVPGERVKLDRLHWSTATRTVLLAGRSVLDISPRSQFIGGRLNRAVILTHNVRTIPSCANRTEFSSAGLHGSYERLRPLEQPLGYPNRLPSEAPSYSEAFRSRSRLPSLTRPPDGPYGPPVNWRADEQRDLPSLYSAIRSHSSASSDYTRVEDDRSSYLSRQDLRRPADDDFETNPRDPKVPKKIPVACNFCRGRKLRCDGVKPTCCNCSSRRINCTYVDQPKRRGPGKATKGSKTKKRASKGGAKFPSRFHPSKTSNLISKHLHLSFGLEDRSIRVRECIRIRIHHRAPEVDTPRNSRHQKGVRGRHGREEPPGAENARAARNTVHLPTASPNVRGRT